jgi:hypothetical protein
VQLPWDFQYHLVWSVNFSEQLFQGELYPRWIQEMNGGLGSPDFFFYPPLPYFFTSLFSLLTSNEIASCNTITPLGFSTWIALIASGLTAYLWLQEISSRNAALIVGILYMAWPYHLIYTLYRSFALAEYWAFVWLPLILFFSRQIIKGKRFCALGMAVSLALLILTHLPTFVLFLPVAASYILFSNFRREIVVRLLISLFLAVGMSAIYWLPAITTQEYVPIENMASEAFYFANNFLFSNPEFHSQRLWLYLEITTTLTLGLACRSWLVTRKLVRGHYLFEVNYWFVVALASFFMMIPASYPVWIMIPTWQKVQFPWRFNVVLVIAASTLVALFLPLAKKQFENLYRQRFLRRFSQLWGAIVISTILLFLPAVVKIGKYDMLLTFFSWSFFILLVLNLSKLKSSLWINFFLVGTLFMAGVLPFSHYIFQKPSKKLVADVVQVSPSIWYPPKWVPAEIASSPHRLDDLSRRTPQVATDSVQTSIKVIQWYPRKLLIQSNSPVETKATLGQFYYPGWQARLVKSNRLISLKASEFGLIELAVPKGNHLISVELKTLPEERVGYIISLIALLGFVLICAKNFYHSRFAHFHRGV